MNTLIIRLLILLGAQVLTWSTLPAQDTLLLTDGSRYIGEFYRIKNQKVQFFTKYREDKIKARLDRVETINFGNPQNSWFSEENPYFFARPKIFGIAYYINDQPVRKKYFYTALELYPETRGKVILGQTIRVVGYSTTAVFALTGLVGVGIASIFGTPSTGEVIRIMGIATVSGYIVGGGINFLGKKIMTSSTDKLNRSRLQYTSGPRLNVGIQTNGIGFRLDF